jgi:hypothetical protein
MLRTTDCVFDLRGVICPFCQYPFPLEFLQWRCPCNAGQRTKKWCQGYCPRPAASLRPSPNGKGAPLRAFLYMAYACISGLFWISLLCIIALRSCAQGAVRMSYLRFFFVPLGKKMPHDAWRLLLLGVAARLTVFTR